MLFQLLILLISNSIVVYSAPGSALLGAKECTWGPTYWCKNLTSASSCHAVPHCIQTVWEHQTVLEDNDDICTLCKNMVVQARDQLESNETMDEIRQVFEGTCKLIYVKPAVKICDKIADELVPELVDTISSQMNPDVVCSVAGLCNNAEIDNARENNDVVDKNTRIANYREENCNICGRFVNRTHDLLTSNEEAEIMNYFHKICGKLSSYSDACKHLISENFENILAHLRNEMTADKVCYISGSCVNNRKPLPGDETCDLCKQLVLHFKDIVISDTTEAEFVKVLHGLCKQTGKFADECQAMVDNYGNKIYEIFSHDLDPSRICGFFEICPGPGIFINGPVQPMLPEPAESLTHVQINSRTNVQINSPIKPAEPGCAMCLVLVETIYSEIKSNNSEAAIEKAVKGVCEKMPTSLVSECDDMVLKYTLELIDMVTANFRPEQTCAYLKICKPKFGIIKGTHRMAHKTHKTIDYGDPIENPVMPMTLLTPPQLQMDLRVNGQQTCIFCQYLLHYLQKVLSQPYGEEALKKAFDGICEKLPRSVSVQCVDFVNLYGDAFVAILAQEIDPSQVCPTLHICPAKMDINGQLEGTPLRGKPVCPLCLYVMETIDDEIKDQKNEQTIRNALEGVCKKLPKQLVHQCDELVDEYTEELIDLLIADFTPNEICVYLKLCKPKKFIEVEVIKTTPAEPYEILTNEIPDAGSNVITHPKKMKIQQKDTTPTASPSCILCEYVVEKLDHLITKNSSQEEIENALHKVCDLMPHTVRKDCEKFVVKNGQELLNTLAILIEPSQVCSFMGLCLKGTLGLVQESYRKCSLCEAVVGAINALLEDPQRDFNIAKNIEQVCQFVPARVSSQCHVFINTYGAQIISMIVDMGLHPSVICWKLNLCARQQVAKVEMKLSSSTPLIGGEKCTWGPGYWCQNEMNAKTCGTLAHCQEIVWKAQKPANSSIN